MPTTTRRPRFVVHETATYLHALNVGCPVGHCAGSIGRDCTKPGGGCHKARLDKAAKALAQAASTQPTTPEDTMATRMRPTHTYTATTCSDGDPSPFTGLPVTLLRQHAGCDHAGFDCLILLHCTPAALAARYSKLADRTYTADQITDWHSADGYVAGALPDEADGGLVVCANVARDLTAL